MKSISIETIKTAYEIYHNLQDAESKNIFINKLLFSITGEDKYWHSILIEQDKMYFEKISGENKYVDVVYTSETEASNEVIKLFFIDEENKVYDIEGQEIQSDPNTYYRNIIKGYDIMVDRTIKSVKDTLPFKFSNLFEEYKLDGKGAMLFIDSNKKLHTNEGESKYKVLKVCKLDGKADILIMEDGSEYVGYLK